MPPRPDRSGSSAAGRWWPTLVVLLVIVGLIGGARAVADTLAGPLEPVTGFPGVVEVAPRPGWVQVSYEDTGSVDQLVLAKGAMRLSVMARPGVSENAADVAATYAQQRQAMGSFFPGDAKEVTLAGGAPAIVFPYTAYVDGVAVFGTVTAAVGKGGVAVVFDAYGPEQDWTAAVAGGDLRAMIDGAAIA